MIDLRGFVFSAITSAALAGMAHAQAPSAPPPANPEAPDPERDKVVVTGKPLDEAIREFVDGIASSSSKSQNQMARWDQRICPGLLGLKPEVAQLFLDRIAYRALSVGLEIGDPGCKANILIVVTQNPDDIARQLYDNFGRRIGRYKERGIETQGRTALNAFVNSDAPVRWWHVANTVTRDGDIIRSTAQGEAPVLRLTGNLSRITRMTRQDFSTAFVIVDATKVQKVNFGGLADYLAMASLAQLDPSSDASGVPSILNLFEPPIAGQPAMTDMTQWDLAYLRGLYAMERESGSARRQESDIARSIAKDFASEAAED